MIQPLFLTLILLFSLSSAGIPHGLYHNGEPDRELYRRHLPHGIAMDSSTLQCDRVLVNRGYVSCYSYQTNTPLWSAYTITDEEAKRSSPRYSRFLYDRRVPRRHRVKPTDYAGSGHDRGHLFPNALADGEDVARQAQSFLMSNVAPQDPQLNRVGWKYLENAVHKWLRRHGKLEIVTGVWFSPESPIIGKRKQQKIAVPSYWYKIVYDPRSHKAIAFWMPNASVGKREWYRYRTSIDTIEARTGIDFLPGLPDDIERKVESDSRSRF